MCVTMPRVLMRGLEVELRYSRLQRKHFTNQAIFLDPSLMVDSQQCILSGCMRGNIAQNLNFLNGSPKELLKSKWLC